ncbi:hypothetical protein EI555_004850 [Monodon monoceros]|uniref:Condensin-2 complex subunit G2 n=1 Tax=Monodon monoceros TaxID=40151 RepID=A0A4U1EXK9_MONMO|nr:hypothetical protein EI555_004850 [Monodon monoceros]
MEKRETFVQAVSKELIGEFLQFIQLDKKNIEIIHAITSVILASVSVINESENYEALLECAVILNGILYALPESERELQGSIQDLCVMWWERGLPAKEDMGKTAFVMLLRRSLKTKTVCLLSKVHAACYLKVQTFFFSCHSQGADICRLWRIHQALYCFDYDLEESREIKDMLLECFINVNYIRKEEGRRFLSSLFNWNINFIKMIHGTIKNQLQGLQKSLMVHIAEVYFRAWKKASGKILEAIENGCIQDFLYHGVHLPRKSPVHTRVREVLSYLHRQKEVRQGVEEMLYRLYKPILWRGLKARNSEVRSNAALLFVEAFPIRDPNFNAIEMDSEIQKQFEELYSLLEDPYPMVRSTGILGVCKITSKYWEMLPPTILIDLLKKVTEELAFDTSSADVRCSVFKCLPIILDNKLSHPLLEQLLPTLKYCLHDNSEKVRVAFVDMLLKVKAVRAAKFWKICPMEHILVRLESDSLPVTRRLVGLIFNSFLPVNQPEEVWCERCVTLLQMNHAAARRFYQHAHEHTACTNIAKLIHVIRHCLNACIRRALSACGEGSEEPGKENVSALDQTLSISDTASMAGLLEIVVILWRSIHRSMENNKEARVYTVSKFASMLPEYMKAFKVRRATLLRQARQGNSASKRKVRVQDPCPVKPGLALVYVEYLLTHPKNRECLLSAPQKKLNRLLKALETSKHQTSDVGGLEVGSGGCRGQGLDELDPEGSLSSTYEKVSSCPFTGGLEEGGHSPCCSGSPLLAQLCPHFMRCLLSRNLACRCPVSQVDLESILQSPGGSSHHLSEGTALRAFSLHCRLSIHLQHESCSEGKVYLSTLEDTGFWLESKVLSFIQDQEEEYLKLHRVVYQQIIQTYLTVCKDVIVVGLGDCMFQTQLLQRSLGIMQTVKGFFYVSLLLGILKEVTRSSLTQKADSEEEVSALFDLVQKVFQQMLECMARSFRKQPEEGLQLLYSVQTPLHEFISTVQSWHVDTPVHRGVLSTLIAASVVEISHRLRKVSDTKELTPPEGLSALPPFSRCLIGIIIKSPNVVRSFLDELKACVISEDIEGIVCLTAVMHIILVINKGKHKSSKVKGVAATVHRKLKTFMEITLEEDSLER